MLKVKIKLFATLRRGRFEIDEREFESGTTINSILKNLDLPEKDVSIIFFNGHHAYPGYQVKNEDTIAFFPPIGGG